jgi:hypothetical protein
MSERCDCWADQPRQPHCAGCAPGYRPKAEAQEWPEDVLAARIAALEAQVRELTTALELVKEAYGDADEMLDRARFALAATKETS